VLCVPVRDHENRTVAVIEAVNKRGGVFEETDRTLMEAMAASAGIILRKAQLYEEALRGRQRTEALLEVTEIMSAEMSMERLVEKIVAASHVLVPAQRVLLYVVDEAAHELVAKHGEETVRIGVRLCARAWVRGRALTVGVFLRASQLGQGVVGYVALTGRGVSIPVADADWRFVAHAGAEGKHHGAVRSILALPIKDFMGKTVAVLEACNRVGDSLVPESPLALRSAPQPQPQPQPPAASSEPSSSSAAAAPHPSSAFSAEDMTVLQSLCVTAGSVLRKAQLYEEAIQRRKQTETLLQITEMMAAEVGAEKVMNRIIEATYTLINAERISLFVVDRRSREVRG
jgi:GAF domain-containing protein